MDYKFNGTWSWIISQRDVGICLFPSLFCYVRHCPIYLKQCRPLTEHEKYYIYTLHDTALVPHINGLFNLIGSMGVMLPDVQYCSISLEFCGLLSGLLHDGIIMKISKTYEPPRGKTNNVVFEQVRHKPACTVTKKS